MGGQLILRLRPMRPLGKALEIGNHIVIYELTGPPMTEFLVCQSCFKARLTRQYTSDQNTGCIGLGGMIPFIARKNVPLRRYVSVKLKRINPKLSCVPMVVAWSWAKSWQGVLSMVCQQDQLMKVLGASDVRKSDDRLFFNIGNRDQELHKDFPLVVIIETSSYCNLLCLGCP